MTGEELVIRLRQIEASQGPGSDKESEHSAADALLIQFAEEHSPELAEGFVERAFDDIEKW